MIDPFDYLRRSSVGFKGTADFMQEIIPYSVAMGQRKMTPIQYTSGVNWLDETNEFPKAIQNQALMKRENSTQCQAN